MTLLLLLACAGNPFDIAGGSDDAASTKSADNDGDGYNSTAYGGDDCDDTDAAVNPGAPEVCDSVDNDCDGYADDDDTNRIGRRWGPDFDGDLYVGEVGMTTACDIHSLDEVVDLAGGDSNELDSWGEVDSNQIASDGTFTNADCDDERDDVYPGADEVCDEVDNDCNDVADDGTGSPSTWYADMDADTFGDADLTTDSCSQPDGYVSNDDDCDDDDPDVSPDAVEMCDEVDNDCDGSTDGTDAVDTTTWYLDLDSDEYGDGSSYEACDAPPGYVAVDGDCDDGDADANPGAAEVCDSVDNDCNELVDDGDGEPTTWYRDADGDLYGDATYSFSSCSAPSSYVGNSTDCDDGDADVNPAATEVFNIIDDDCDLDVDEDVECTSDLVVLDVWGDPDEIVVTATDTAFNGLWWNVATGGSDVTAVMATMTNLGGLYRETELYYDMCFIEGVTELNVTGTFGSHSLCTVGGPSATVFASTDGYELDVTEIDDSTGGCSFRITR